MDSPKRRRHTSAIAAAVVLVPVIGFIIYSSMNVAQFECTVCVPFDGMEDCRTVEGKTKEEGIRTAVTNACAHMTAGMTNSMRCERTQPSRAECRKL